MSNLHADAGFYQRLTLIERDCPGASVVLHTQGILEGLRDAVGSVWPQTTLQTSSTRCRKTWRGLPVTCGRLSRKPNQ